MKTLFFFLLLGCSSVLFGAGAKDVSLSIALQEFRSNIDRNQYQLNSQKVDLDLLQEKMQELDKDLSTLKQQIGENTKVDREVTKDKLAALEKRVQSLEKTNDTIISDLLQLKNHFNESSNTIVQCKNKLNDLDKQLSQDIKSLKKAIESMVALVPRPTKEIASHTPAASPMQHYKVKPGDSLGKIAQDHNVDIKTLKELNNLNNDKIFVGQLIQLP